MAVLFNVNLNIALSTNLLDNLTAGTDNFTDFIYRNYSRKQFWSVLRQFLPRLRNSLQHHFIQNVITCLMSFIECFLDHFRCQTADFQIHLNSSDTLFGTGYLKVHITEEIFQSLNIHHSHPAVTLSNQTAGNTGNRCLDRYTGIHQRKCGTTDGTL